MANIRGTVGNDTLTGTNGNDAINLDAAGRPTGTPGDDILFGLAGVDRLYGGDGDDVLDGGTDADRMFGGLGNDIYVVDNVRDKTVEAPADDPHEGVDTVLSSVTHTLDFGIENLTLTGSANINGTGNELRNLLTGNSANNVLSGGDGDDSLSGGAGNDRLDGGAGIDYANYTDERGGVTAGVTVNLGLAGAQNTVGAGFDQLVNIENLVGSSFNDTFIGNAGANELVGRDGNDTLNGGAGDDRLIGEGGDDRLNGDAGNDRLDGRDGNDILNGGSNNDSLSGGAGNDTLDGGTGIDTLNGDRGDDTYIVDNVGDIAAEFSSGGGGGGVDLVKTSVTHTLNSNLENLTLTGAAAINGTGNLNANILVGNSGNNVLTGGLGLDTLNGGAGHDTFDYNAVDESPVGANRDTIIGFAGNGAAAGDRIDLSTIDANSVVSGDQAFIFGGPFTAGHLRYVGDLLQGNTDADVEAEFEIQLVGAPTLVGSDIVL